MTNKELTKKAFELRREVVKLVCHAKGGHIGGDLSMMDIVTYLYLKQMNVSPENFKDDNRDRFVLSKGHSVETLYVVLAESGFFDKKELETYGKFGSRFISHPTRAVNGIEMNTGSLGHGLSIAVGMALSGKRDRKDYRVYTVLGDGELAEGSVWEGVMSGAHFKLDNLTAVVDYNGLQISGPTKEVMSQENQALRWKSFGWNTIEANGHDMDDLERAFDEAKAFKGKPSVIIAHTTKGRGVSFMEDKAGWHHRVPSEDELKTALEELSDKEAAV